MTQSKHRALPAGFRLENYIIVRELSSGGFSQVYLALDQHDRKFAIKEYLPQDMTLRQDDGGVTILNELDREAFRVGLKCFFEEARILSGIQHPNIVRVVNVFRANSTVYMVMEYTEGRSLSKELSLSPGGLPEVRIRKLFAELLGGLAVVHQQQLLHLDIKPGNIYLRRNGTPVLLDFGAARQTLRLPGQSFSVMFTPGYAAPEQYDGKAKLGPWTDIYGLGACIYTMMGGARLPPADERLKQDQLPAASKLFAYAYSRELLELVDRCLALDPLLRPGSLDEIRSNLLSSDYITPVAKPTLWQRALSWLPSTTRRKS